jgi:hypothetical protein
MGLGSAAKLWWLLANQLTQKVSFEHPAELGCSHVRQHIETCWGQEPSPTGPIRLEGAKQPCYAFDAVGFLFECLTNLGYRTTPTNVSQ